MNLTNIKNMQKEVAGSNPDSRPKIRNHAGLYLVVRNDSALTANTLQQDTAGITQRLIFWTAFGTFIAGMLCLLIK
jgi:hypothetical protein